MTAAGAPRRRRGRRVLVVAAVLLAAISIAAAVALPGLDRRAQQAATEAVAAQLQRELGLPEPPQVTVGGRWFLPQLLTGRYGEGTVTAASLTRDGATVRQVRVRLSDVRVPLPVLLGRGGAVDVGSGTARALVPWREVEARVSASSGRAVALAAAGDDVRASTTVTVLRREVDLALTVTPELRAGSVRLRPVSAAVAGRELAVDDARGLLGRVGLAQAAPLLDGVDVGLEQVPPEVRLVDLEVVPDGLVARAELAPLSVPVASR